jgi:hypothetical protein
VEFGLSLEKKPHVAPRRLESAPSREVKAEFFLRWFRINEIQLDYAAVRIKEEPFECRRRIRSNRTAMDPPAEEIIRQVKLVPG